MSKSKIFLYFCLAFIAGIFFSSLFHFPQLLMLGFLIFGIFLISVFWSHKKIVFVGFCLLFLLAGVWRHQQAELKIANSGLAEYNERGVVSFTGQVVEEPDVRTDNVKLTVRPLELPGQGPREIDGKILVTVGRYPEYQYGDRVRVGGELKSPGEFEDFNYKDYLAKEGIYSVMYHPQVEPLAKKNNGGQTSVIYGKILGVKNKLKGSIYQNFSPPQSSILGAIILGDKRKISEEWKQKLNVAGVRHITAISGMHVAVLTAILMSALIGFGLWRKQAFYLTILLITVFIVMTGFQPSAIRAGIMAGLFLLAQQLGRQNFSSRAVVFAAVLMLAQNPLLLRLDVGFQLSFLAVMGIIYLLPLFRDWLKFIPLENSKNILAMTFSAYLFTLPILIYNFGYFSVVAPITNVLIIPLLPYIMVSGFLFAIAGVIWQPLGWVLSWPAWFFLTYLKTVVDFFSQIPLASLTVENLHWAWLVIVYSILGFSIRRLKQREKLKFLDY